MNPQTNKLLGTAFNWVFMALGIGLYVTGYVCFQLPYSITSGGVAGIASVIYFGTGIPPSYTYLVINVFLLILALRILGLKFMVNTIYAVAVMSFALGVGQELFTQNGELPRLLGDQSFMACVIAAVLEGSGLAIVFLNNGSTGGTDIIAACVNKYRDISLGHVLLICDMVVVSSNYIVFQRIDLLLYGCCTMMIGTFTLDYVMTNHNQSVQFLIISQKYDEIAKSINETGRGVTVLDGKGWFTQHSQKVLMVLARRRESMHIFQIIKSTDPNAFVSQSKVVGVFGKGFDTIKGK